MKLRIRNIILCIIGLSIFCACSFSYTTSNPIDIVNGTNTGAAEQDSHSNEAEPDYDIVFPDDQVNEITITISSENWDAVFTDMVSNYGAFGNGSGMGADKVQPDGNRQQVERPQQENMPEMQNPPADKEFNPQNGGERQQPLDGGGPGMGNKGGNAGGILGGGDENNPIWVEATIDFGDEVWEHIGFRLKGNSSLKHSWNSGNNKLPFKLDFDQYEDDYPETENQRFYGFKQLTFSSNYSDSSYLAEKMAADIFRDAGVPAAHTAFYAVYIDYGEGPIYYGLYTAVEVVDDTVIETQFEDDSGNVYKPSGEAASFAAGTHNEAQYDKETNQEEGDYSDVQALLEVLNSNLRTTNPSVWRAELESVFDVENFLQWLAVNTTIQNWDTYGSIAHNYYLYHDPVSDQLVWIPWDNNEAFSVRSVGGGRNNKNDIDYTEFDYENLGANWPLISYLLADEVYLQQYNESIEDVINNVVNIERLTPIFTDLHNLISPYVEMEQEGYTTLTNFAAFNNSLNDLIEHINSRYNAALEYLSGLD